MDDDDEEGEDDDYDEEDDSSVSIFSRLISRRSPFLINHRLVYSYSLIRAGGSTGSIGWP